MKRTEPPIIATWMLEHFTPGNCNDALFGDLAEEFHSGRSAGWYWRQVLAAIAMGFLREIRGHSLLLIFAALWIVPSRAWWSFAFWFATHQAGLLLPWPYSPALGMTIVVFQSLWAGLAIYISLYSLAGRNSNLEKVGRGFWIAPLMFLFLTILIRISCRPLGIPIASLGVFKLATDFLSLIVAAWGVKPRTAIKSATVGLHPSN